MPQENSIYPNLWLWIINSIYPNLWLRILRIHQMFIFCSFPLSSSSSHMYVWVCVLINFFQSHLRVSWINTSSWNLSVCFSFKNVIFFPSSIIMKNRKLTFNFLIHSWYSNIINYIKEVFCSQVFLFFSQPNIHFDLRHITIISLILELFLSLSLAFPDLRFWSNKDQYFFEVFSLSNSTYAFWAGLPRSDVSSLHYIRSRLMFVCLNTGDINFEN